MPDDNDHRGARGEEEQLALKKSQTAVWLEGLAFVGALRKRTLGGYRTLVSFSVRLNTNFF
jgi:hypothetical protein